MGSLVGLLSDQKSEFTGALPGGLGNLSSMLDGGAAAAASAVEPVKEAGSSIWRWLLPLLLVLGALWLVSQFMGGSDEPGQTSQVETGAPSVSLYFELGSADLPTGAAADVNEIVSYMKANPTVTASIAGYHDRSGAAGINEQLAKDRAVAVQRLLLAGGIDSNRLVLDEPLISAAGSDDDARRVDVVVR
jgi:outer membrane protein OmpA-like peptidoglycan-associated protein